MSEVKLLSLIDLGLAHDKRQEVLDVQVANGMVLYYAFNGLKDLFDLRYVEKLEDSGNGADFVFTTFHASAIPGGAISHNVAVFRPLFVWAHDKTDGLNPQYYLHPNART